MTCQPCLTHLHKPPGTILFLWQASSGVVLAKGFMKLLQLDMYLRGVTWEGATAHKRVFG